jgi:hypothetical protein
MMLLTKAHRERLLQNHEAQAAKISRTGGDDDDLTPVVKLFDAFGQAFWLLTEMDEDGIAYGLCDLGMGFPEIGSVSIAELEALEFMSGCPRIERDRHFRGEKPLSEYAAQAREGVRP